MTAFIRNFVHHQQKNYPMLRSLIFLLIAIAYSANVALGDVGGTTPPTGPKEEVAIQVKNLRPHDTSSNPEVICYVYEQYVTLSFQEFEGFATVAFYSYAGTPLYQGVYSTASTITIPFNFTDRPILIAITTSHGNEYEGWITVQ
ncbi:MAG: hypothetical protein LUD17_09615 [Bacteroidales bacterium]|nr:hypothetical protein [Bacteroidales bacterium]